MGCKDDPNYTFFRTFGDDSVSNCAHFERRHDSSDYCLAFGDTPDPNGLTPNSSCCVCGGGIMQEYKHPDIVNGVIEIELGLLIADSDSFALEDEAVTVLETMFGENELFSMFDHVMLCFPPGTKRYGSPAWRAYAYVNHYLTVYHDDWCNYPKTQVHEIAHNLGLMHAWKMKPEQGQEETVMGRGFAVDEGPSRAQVCFNPAKSYQLGWYQDKVIDLDPIKTSWHGNLIGVGNYQWQSPNAVVVIKLPAAGKEDYYVGFNHAIGHHVGTSFGINMVKIVRQGQNFAESWMEAVLGSGESHVIPNYLGTNRHLVMQVLETNGNGDNFAEVGIFTFAKDDLCFGSTDFELNVNATIARATCEWFRENELEGCPVHGNSLGSCGNSKRCTASLECCHCGGGIRTTQSPTNVPSSMPSSYPIVSLADRTLAHDGCVLAALLWTTLFFILC